MYRPRSTYKSMPSRKYKRRKKNYKHCKHGDSSEEEIDEHWSVDYGDSDDEDTNKGKRLTTLVRKSYLKHLQETLIKNYEEWKKSVKGTDPGLSMQKWVTVLEQKALRSCMVAELYRKTMITMISDIKKHTQQRKLHISVEPVSKLGHLLTVDKETQSDLEPKKAKNYSVETQTGKSYASLLDYPLPKEEPSALSPAIRGLPIPTIDQLRDCIAKVTPVPRSNNDNKSDSTPYNPFTSFSPSENSLTNVIDPIVNVPKMVPPPSVTNNIVNHSINKNASNIQNFPLVSLILHEVESSSNSNPVSKDNVLDPQFETAPKMVPPPSSVNNSVVKHSTVDNLNGVQSVPSLTSIINETESILKSNTISKEDILLDLQSEFSVEKENYDVTDMDIDNENILDILSEIEHDQMLSESKQNMPRSFNKKSKMSDHPSDCLDARLTAMGLLEEDDTEKQFEQQQFDNKHKRSNWFLEFIAQSCNLTRIMLAHKPKQREKLLAKFEKLFGPSSDADTELSVENIKICRKRIASVVVAELTPMYQAKRIGSRHLFKLLAKQATNNLMKKSFAPESRFVRKHVQSIFESNKNIKCEADIQLLF